MITIDVLIPFLAATIVLNLTPGSDVLFVSTQAMSHGIKGGILAALGVSVGIIFHTALVSFGLAELLSLYPLALTIIKMVGAAYLLYLAISSWRSKNINWEQNKTPNLTTRKIFFRGALTNILNPKMALFFLAFLPQFIKAEQGAIFWQTVQLGTIFIISGTIVNSTYALIFAYARNCIQGNQRFSLYLNKITAGIFGALAMKMITTD